MTQPETQALVSLTQIIVDGRMLHRGHRWAWRRGVVIGTGTHGFLRVRLERRGRERRRPEADLAPSWCLGRTLALEATLRRAKVIDGMDDAGEEG